MMTFMRHYNNNNNANWSAINTLNTQSLETIDHHTVQIINYKHTLHSTAQGNHIYSYSHFENIHLYL